MSLIGMSTRHDTKFGHPEYAFLKQEKKNISRRRTEFWMKKAQIN